jgi:hypothetical protein
VCTVVFAVKSYLGNQLIHQSGILPGAEVLGAIGSARKGVVVDGASTTLQPCQDTCPCRFEELELNGPACLLLNRGGSCADTASADEVTYVKLDQIATAQLTVDGEIEQCAVSEASLSVESEPDGPPLLRI